MMLTIQYLNSPIDRHTPSAAHLTLTFDLLTSGSVHVERLYMCSDFGVNGSSRFYFRARTDRQTDRDRRNWSSYPRLGYRLLFHIKL